MEAGPRDTVWLTPLARDGCRRLISFRDGIATSHLDTAACIEELEIAPDGTAWVVDGVERAPRSRAPELRASTWSTHHAERTSP